MQPSMDMQSAYLSFFLPTNILALSLVRDEVIPSNVV